MRKLARKADRLIANTQTLVHQMTVQMEASDSNVTRRPRRRKTRPKPT